MRPEPGTDPWDPVNVAGRSIVWSAMTDTVADDEFEQLVQREWHAVLAVAVALVGHDGAAEELTQEGFVSAHRRWSHVGTLERPGAWVRRVVINRSVSHLRRRAAERRALARVGGDRSGRDSADGGTAALHRSALDADHELWARVRALPRRQAQVVVLRHVDGLSTGEIAEVLGCAEATVRVHLHRALATLRAHLAVGADRIETMEAT